MPASARPPALLFVNQYYHPDVAATGQHLADLAEYLAARGASVTILAARAAYADRPSSSQTREAKEVRNGVMIRRFRTTSFGRGTQVGRLIDYLSFYVQVLLAVLFGRRHDLSVYLTTPPLIGIVGLIARVLRGERYAIWSMDLHPQAEIAVGMLRAHSLATQALMWVWRTMHKRAHLVIALGPFMQARMIEDGVPRERLTIVPPWSNNAGEPKGVSDQSGLRQRLGLGDRFLVMYSGNAGLVHDFAAICEAMRLLKEDDRMYFLFVGGGPRRGEIENFARAHQVRNFAYLGYSERGDVSELLTAADAHLIALRHRFAGVSVPSKLYGILASGRPALFVGPTDCESAETILRADCGAVINSADPNAAFQVVEVIRSWYAAPARREMLGANGRAWFERHHTAEGCCGEIENRLSACMVGRKH